MSEWFCWIAFANVDVSLEARSRYSWRAYEAPDARRVDLGDSHTFLSLFFSAVSSLPALAACRFSCFAVNYPQMLAVGPHCGVVRPDFEVEQGLLKPGHGGCERPKRGLSNAKYEVLSVSDLSVVLICGESRGTAYS